MIGLDTNVLLRALLADQGDEGARARDLMIRHCSPAAPAFINHVVLCEAVWTLVRTYRYSREQILAAIATILATPAFVVPERRLVEEAMRAFGDSGADFTDVLIGVLNRSTGCTTTYTFDRRAAGEADFTAVD